MGPVKQALIDIVNCIPRGKAISYGQLAPYVSQRSGKTISAQMVGRQLSGMDESEWNNLPWWRVVSKEGKISSLKLGSKGRKQIQLLEAEGFEVVSNQINMTEYRWEGLDTVLDLLSGSNEGNPN